LWKLGKAERKKKDPAQTTGGKRGGDRLPFEAKGGGKGAARRYRSPTKEMKDTGNRRDSKTRKGSANMGPREKF